jgi:hypothetical protein
LEDWRRSETSEQAERAMVKGGSNTIALLLEMLFTKDTEAERKAFENMDKEGLRHYGFTPRVYNLHSEAQVGFAMLGTNAISAIPQLAKLFLDFRTHNDGRNIISHIGDSAVMPLVSVLTNHIDRDFRNGAAIALGLSRFNAAPAVAALVKALSDQDWNVRVSAANSLGNIRLDRNDLDSALVVPALAKALSDNSSIVRSAAADSLIKYRKEGKQAINALLEACNDKDAHVGYSAAISLASIDREAGKKVVPILLKAARDEDWTISNSAVSLLKEIAPDEAAKAQLAIKDPFKIQSTPPQL